MRLNQAAIWLIRTSIRCIGLACAIRVAAGQFSLFESPLHVDNNIISDRFPTDGSALVFFNTSDGVEVTWYHGANSQEKIEEAVSGHYMMIEGDVTLRWYGFPNQTEEPIMAHPPEVDSDLTLDEWLEAIISTPGKGMKLDFKNNDAVRPSLELLESKADRLDQPVWINADIVRGPMGGRPLDAHRFLDDVNELFPQVTLSLGWTTGCCLRDYTRAMMESMWAVVNTTTQPVTYPVRAALLRDSWEEFRWLLSQDLQRSTLTVWTPSGSDDWEGASEWDMLYCRNDAAVSMIYYDLPGEKFDSFRNISVTAGSLVNYFPVENRDGIEVTWAHAVNSRAELEEALCGDAMMLEADVILRGEGTDNETDTPVMGHPPANDSDITLQEWLDIVVLTDRGIKLDFKSTASLEASLLLMNEMRFEFVQPIFINADIFEGPGGTSTPVNATQFKEMTNELFPWATLSIGWTTGWNNNPDVDPVYSEEMVTEMLLYSEDFEQPITYPVRAAMTFTAWDELQRLLEATRGTTLTIWSSEQDEVDPEELVCIRQDSEIARIYYDLPDDQMEDFLNHLNETCSLSTGYIFSNTFTLR